MVSLDSTLGAAYIGVVIAGILHGVTCAQALYYCLHQTDTWRLKGAVTAVMLSDTIHQALISHTVYTHVISNNNNPAALADTGWSLLLEVLFNGFTALLVQGFLTMRVWHLTSRNIWLAGLVSSFVVGEFGCVVVFAVYALFHVHTFEDLGKLKALSITVNALAACGDITITATLVHCLVQARPCFVNSRKMIKTLIIYSINIGLITTLCAIASLVSILAWGDTFIYITFFFCIGRLYSNNLLATLNARKRIRKSGEGVNTISDDQGVGFSLKDEPGTLGTKTSVGRVGSGLAFSGGGRHTTSMSATDRSGMATPEKDNDASGSSKDFLTFREMISETTGLKEIV